MSGKFALHMVSGKFAIDFKEYPFPLMSKTLVTITCHSVIKSEESSI